MALQRAPVGTGSTPRLERTAIAVRSGCAILDLPFLIDLGVAGQDRTTGSELDIQFRIVAKRLFAEEARFGATLC